MEKVQFTTSDLSQVNFGIEHALHSNCIVTHRWVLEFNKVCVDYRISRDCEQTCITAMYGEKVRRGRESMIDKSFLASLEYHAMLPRIVPVEELLEADYVILAKILLTEGLVTTLFVIRAVCMHHWAHENIYGQ